MVGRISESEDRVGGEHSLSEIKEIQRKLRNIAFTYETERKEKGTNAVPSQKSGFLALS